MNTIRAKMMLAALLLGGAACFAQTNIYPWPSSGNVGIGTTTPSDALNVMGKVGVGGTTSSSNMDSNVTAFLTRTTTNSGGVSLLQHNYFAADSVAGGVLTSLLGDVINQGNDVDAEGHWVGMIGRAQDTVDGHMPIIGLEGKVILRGTTNSAIASWAIADYIGSSFSGRQITCFAGFPEIKNAAGEALTGTDGGMACVFRAFRGVGGNNDLIFSFLGDPGMKMINQGAVIVADADGTFKNVAIQHTGTDGVISCSAGALRLAAPTTNYLVMEQGIGFVPLTDGTPLGETGLSNHRWALNATTGTFSGNVGIGTTAPAYALDVAGTVHATNIISDSEGADYVFEPDYTLMPLAEVEAHIKEQKHLPGIPSAREMSAKGVNIAELQTKLLAKIEELTLHQIEQEKQLQALKLQNTALQAQVEKLSLR